MKKSILTASVAVMALMSSAAFAQSESFCSTTSHSSTAQKVTISRNQTGTIGEIGYELWDENGSGGNATFYDDGSMDCNITSAKDYLCRAGLSLGSTKTYDQLGGDMIAEFKLIKNSGQNVQYSYIGVYGWMQQVQGAPSNLVEYYVIDNTLSSGMPGDWIGNEKKGTIQVDGGTYTVYRNTRTGPAIGTSQNVTFYQYFSVRNQMRDCGTINISEHMRQWEKMGMTMGKLYEAKVLGEAGNTSSNVSGGKMDFPYAKVYIKGSETAKSSESTQPASSASVAKSSESVAKSSNSFFGGSSNSFFGGSSNSFFNRSSASVVPGSSEAVVPGSSAGMALPAFAMYAKNSGTFQVFDMQGHLLGKVEVSQGARIGDVLMSRFHKAGIYLLKNGNSLQTVSVAK